METGPEDGMRTVVVAAALLREEGKILLAQRVEGDEQALLWEFPGGKVEQDEEPRQALRRELREELGIEAEVGPLFDGTYFFYSDYPVLLLVYACRVRQGIPKPLRCRDLRWVGQDELPQMAMPPADEPIRNRLESEG
jgi:8-oxo-dGTP diphosphatase